ncbi:helix-turn-helix domain-containing protein [Dysgonomonas sp. Marseille-P4677]|uniref:helix-turn-helix domain-containing protein n=1 Tax=Dysgonomonas sp. Marseille-P4677 TaxID=2364790 RepID=UPI0019118E7F|nr:helix-turn-helix domain-containing protein [Dysgonomonas sp. Marseille-P4677]MBK5720182.1 helix-turn-helix domain-containing protein [Dysgonomonas sp. Marseille-P4677]
MEVITIDSEAYKNIVEKIDTIADYVKGQGNPNTSTNLDNEWVDSYEVCTFLKISERTLQRLRTNGIISYSIISGKTYYTIAEIKRVLKERLIKSTDEHLQDLIKGHQEYAEQRRKNKPKMP